MQSVPESKKRSVVTGSQVLKNKNIGLRAKVKRYTHDPIPKDSYPPSMGSICEYLKPSEIDLPMESVTELNPIHRMDFFRYSSERSSILGSRWSPAWTCCRR